MAQQQDNPHTDNNGKEKKSSEPLFGPSIGPVSSGPAWTIGSEKKVVTDELTPEVVNNWIERSKEVCFLFCCATLRPPLALLSLHLNCKPLIFFLVLSFSFILFYIF